MAHSTLLLDAHLKALRLPTVLREYDTVAAPLCSGGARLSTLPVPALRAGAA